MEDELTELERRFPSLFTEELKERIRAVHAETAREAIVRLIEQQPYDDTKVRAAKVLEMISAVERAFDRFVEQHGRTPSFSELRLCIGRPDIFDDFLTGELRRVLWERAVERNTPDGGRP